LFLACDPRRKDSYRIEPKRRSAVAVVAARANFPANTLMAGNCARGVEVGRDFPYIGSETIESATMEERGWARLFDDWSWVRGEGRFPIPAYSEFMPPPRIGQKPYGYPEADTPFSHDDPWGWKIGAHEQEQELTPGLTIIARQLIETVTALATGHGPHRIGHDHLADNLYWPKALAECAGALPQERYLFLSPLALSKTQDDKGRIRWTLFGGSHQGPAQGFWKSFFTAPAVELPREKALDAIRDILRLAYRLQPEQLGDLRSAGFRIVPMGNAEEATGWTEGPLPSWTQAFLLDGQETLDGVRYILTFKPFGLFPEPVQRAYAAGQLHLLPFPGSLVFWGSPLYRRLSGELPLATQILLLQSIARHEGSKGTRVPQAGWLHHAHPGSAAHAEGVGSLRNTFRRSHRWQRVLRGDDSTAFTREDHVHTVLFSTHPDDVGLYGKPMARNTQIWSHEFHSVLDGPAADADGIRRAIGAMEAGGSFGYRFFYPPMQTGRFAQYWHRPLIAFRDTDSGQAKIIDSVLTGYFTALDAKTLSCSDVELWPRLGIGTSGEPRRAIPLHRERPTRPTAGIEQVFVDSLGVQPDTVVDPSAAITFQKTATRAFETQYWKAIATLAEGRYLNKNSGDCVRDAVTQNRLAYPEKDLEQLGDYLLDYYRRLARAAGLVEQVLIGDMPFCWQTDFEFPWMGGWLDNRNGKKAERNLAVVIPGKNRNETIIMADHYDTAYMEDVYGYRAEAKSDGSRLAASGADDNHSATAALQMAAPIFMELSRAGRLACDIWLVHLTGEEFPSDCLGARDLSQQLVQNTLSIRVEHGKFHDLSGMRVRGLYVLDMIAHNNDRQRDIFQIAPGTNRESLWLAYHAYVASRLWHAGAAVWNEKPARRGLGRARRSPHGGAIPRMARHLAPLGEVRLHDDPRSTLFNTDGQVFSDAGIPAVLFMENYDINRHGYHDSEDTMANIDLDYGAAVASIAIEAVARAAVLHHHL
jgi:hypothetical protein